MSGKKRAEVIEAMEITVTAVRRAREQLGAGRERLGVEAMTSATDGLARAREALQQTLAGVETLEEGAERDEMMTRYDALARDLAQADRQMQSLAQSFECARRHLTAVEDAVDEAIRLDRAAREHLSAEDRHMEQAGLPGEWFRDAEYRETRAAFEAASRATRELRLAAEEFDAVGARVRDIAGTVRDVHTEAVVLKEFTEGAEFQEMLTRIADRRMTAALAARREELAQALAQFPDDYAQWGPAERLNLPGNLIAIDATLAAAEAAPHPGSVAGADEALRAGAAQLALVPAALAQTTEQREMQRKRARIAEAIMETLDEMNFDVSFDPGNRDEPCRISGQTPRSDGDGDFDIAIPLTGEVDFEVAEARGDGHDCHIAVEALRERLRDRFGLSWQVTDWGNAAGIAATDPETAERGGTMGEGEKQRIKHQHRERG